MSDYADWTTSIELLGSTIMVPMDFQGATVMVPLDIQGSTIMMPMDLQGQTVDLDIKIVASEATIDVSIAAQEADIDVNIAAQSGNVTISVAAQSVGVYLQPEWAALQQTDKNFTGTGSNLVTGTYALVQYTVPTGKTLFINSIAGDSHATDAADRDKDQVCAVGIYNETLGAYVFFVGGHGGAGLSFPKPFAFQAGTGLWFLIYNWANHNCNMKVVANGYEV